MIFRIIFILLFAQTAYSQYYETPIDLKTKLSQNSIHSMIEDNEGFYWFGTGDGLNRFDGKKVRIFRQERENDNCICGNEIYDLRVDRLNNLWIATSNCLSKLDLSDYTFHNFYDGQKPTSTPDNYILELALFDDYLAVLTLAGIKLIDIESEEEIIIPNNLKLDYIDIAKFDNDRLLVSTKTAIYSLDITSKRISEYFDFSQEIRPDGMLRDFYYSDFFLFMSFTDQTVSYDTRSKEVKIFDDIGFHVTRDINQWDNKVWFSTSKGLLTFDLVTNEFEHGKKDGLLEGVVINTLTTDANTLLVSYNRGVVQLSKNPPLFRNVLIDPSNDGHSGANYVLDIAAASEGIFVSTENGIYIMDSTDLSTPCTDMYSFIPNVNFVSNVIRDDKHVWISTFDSGLYATDLDSKQTVHFSNDDNSDGYIGSNVIRHAHDTGEYLYVSTDEGLFLLKKSTKEIVEYNYYDIDLHSEMSKKVTSSFVDDRERIWIGTQGGLIVVHPDGQSTYYTTNSEPALSNNRIRKIEPMSDSIMLIATSTGLNYVNIESNTIHSIDVSSGLDNDMIYSFELDRDGDIWVSTNSGISVIYGDYTIANFNVHDGLQGGEYNTNSSAFGGDGIMLFGGLYGVTKFRPDDVKNEVKSKKALITEIEILPHHDQEEKVYLYPLEEQYEFGSEQCNFIVRFTSINYVNPENDVFYYKLEGYDHNWIKVDGETQVQFMNLRQGDYEFKVRTGLSNGTLSESIASVKITINPTFYSSLPFRVASILAIVLLVGLASLWRIKSIESSNELLKNTVAKQTGLLKTANELQETFLKEVPEPLAIYNNNGEIIQANDLYNELVSIDDNRTGEHANTINSIKEKIQEGFKVLNDKNDNTLKEEHLIDEHYFQFKFNRIFVQNENYGTAVLLRDITESKMAEFRLKQNEIIFRSYFEKSPIGIIYVEDPTEPITNCNKKFCEIVGMPMDEVLGKTMQDLTHPDDLERDVARFTKAYRGRQDYITELDKRLIREDGTYRVAETHLTFVYDDDKEFQYLFVLVNDVTDKRDDQRKLIEARTKLIQSEKLASLGQITAGVAHEINNPVNFIYNGVNNLRNLIQLLGQDQLPNQAPLYEDINQMIEAIDDGAIRTAAIVKSLRMFTRDSDNKKKNYDILSGLDSSIVLISYRLKDRITISKDYDFETLYVDCNPIQLNQVFVNVLSNGIDAIEGNGDIKINIHKEDENVVLDFKDTGTGISPDDYSKILEPFYSTKGPKQGSGLGLSISHTIIRDHDGSISFRPNDPQGTIVSITLPLKHKSDISAN